MGGKVQKIIVLIVGVLCLILLLTTFQSCSNVRKFEEKARKEENLRFDAEEKQKKINDERADYEEKAKKLEQELNLKKAEAETVNKALLQQQLLNASLKTEVEKLSKLKETLEEDLKNALVSAGKDDKAKK
jgi:predicted Holliday junction resolvase-like endonuclease